MQFLQVCDLFEAVYGVLGNPHLVLASPLKVHRYFINCFDKVKRKPAHHSHEKRYALVYHQIKNTESKLRTLVALTVWLVVSLH